MARTTARRANGEGSLYERKDHKWLAAVVLEDGRRMTRTCNTQAEGKRKLKELLEFRDQRLDPDASTLMVGQFLLDWLKTKELDVRDSSLGVYTVLMRRMAQQIGKQRLVTLRPQDVKRAYATLLQEGLAPRSVHATHTIFKQAIRDGVRSRMLAWNIMDAVDAPSFERAEITTLTAEQSVALLRAAESSPLGPLIYLLLKSGLRIGEATALRWSDLDLAAGRLYVRNTLRPIRGGFALRPPKTAASRRVIEVAPSIVEVLEQHRTAQRAARPSWEPQLLEWQNLVFTTETGGPLRREFVSAELRSILRAGRLPLVRTHDLRHTFATLQIAAGTNPKVVSEMLGHSNITITLNLYAHVMPGMHRAAADLMDRLVAV